MDSRYFYPYEVVRLNQSVYTKSFVMNLLEKSTCCGCSSLMRDCECPQNEEEKKLFDRYYMEILAMRRKFWEDFGGNIRSSKDIVKYAQLVMNQHTGEVSYKNKPKNEETGQ